MTDVFTAAKRSDVMSRVKGRDTTPERLVRSILHRLGYRFTVNGPKNRRLPGKPDIVLPRHDTVIFVHGCFWHAHDHCEYFRVARTRRTWWKKKSEANRKRDRRLEDELTAAGWNVVTIWECATRSAADREWLVRRLPG